MNDYFVYILSNRKNGTLYIGVTNNLVKRVFEHKSALTKSFTKQYGINKLMYFEQTSDILSAISREKQLKGGSRQSKILLIEKNNPEWIDLYNTII